ncbi:porin, partial [Sutterella massiliensis]
FGRWGIYGLEATPFGNGWGRSGGVHWMAGAADRVDNSISYASPNFNGWQAFGQFSFSTGSNAGAVAEQGKWKHNTRRGGLALRYKTDSFTAIGVVEQIWNTEGLANADYGKDTTIASAAVNFLTVPTVRLFLMGQYFKNVYSAPGTPVHSAQKLIGGGLAATNPTGIEGRGFDGYNVGINAQIKLWGGDLYLTTAYDDWEYKGDVKEGQETSLKHYLVGAAYEYPLSKRVHIYGSANWTHGTGLFDSDNFSDSSDPNSYQVMGGLTYFF